MLGDQLSRRYYEELLGMLIDQKWTFEDHILNVVQKIYQEIHILAKISTYMPQKKLRSTMKALIAICILSTSLDNL